MGTFIWHQWARLLALVCGVYVIWGGVWGIFYRKFFWDFVGGELGPAGLIPGPHAAFFVALIVKSPVLQLLNIVNGLLTLAIEWPLPLVAQTSLYRSFPARIVLYIWASILAFLVYQTVDAGLFYAIAASVYVRALQRGEVIANNKDNHGRGEV